MEIIRVEVEVEKEKKADNRRVRVKIKKLSASLEAAKVSSSSLAGNRKPFVLARTRTTTAPVVLNGVGTTLNKTNLSVCASLKF